MSKYSKPRRPKKQGDEFYIPGERSIYRVDSFGFDETTYCARSLYTNLKEATEHIPVIPKKNSRVLACTLFGTYALIGVNKQVLHVMWDLREATSGEILESLEFVSEGAARAAIAALVRWGFIRKEPIPNSKFNKYTLV